jgi:hypothetical protein
MDYIRPRSGVQPCDTFFIEDDLRVQAEKQAKQEHDKLVARERQFALASQLSRITSAELRDEILQHMLKMDVSCIYGFGCCFCMSKGCTNTTRFR